MHTHTVYTVNNNIDELTQAAFFLLISTLIEWMVQVTSRRTFLLEVQLIQINEDKYIVC